ncbi:MAG: hypothetical protein AAF502_23565 [Bacteroidota bacterium]
MNQVKAKISSKRYIYIKSRDEKFSLDNNFYAINWFNTKFGWMYNLYGLLVGRLLLKSGGRLRFKGSITKVLKGDDQRKRDTLLIVKYPSGNVFKSIVEKKYFQIASLLRINSVDKFTFGFAAKNAITPDRPTRDTQRHYGIHHFKGNDSTLGLLQDPKLRDPVQIIFAGMIKANLFAGDEKEARFQVPCVMDGLIVYAAENEMTLNHFLESEVYQSVIETTESSFIGILKREF